MLTSRALGRDIHFNYFSIALAALFFSLLFATISIRSHINYGCFFFFAQAAGIGEVCLSS